MDVKLVKNKLIIEIDFDPKGKDSSSGKTLVHASTGGNKETALELPNGKKLIVGLNAYTTKKEK